MATRLPAWEYYSTDGKLYKTDKSHRNAWCNACIQREVMHLREMGMVAQSEEQLIEEARKVIQPVAGKGDTMASHLRGCALVPPEVKVKFQRKPRESTADVVMGTISSISAPPPPPPPSSAPSVPSIPAWTLSIPDRERLIQFAIEAKEGSYSPYSKFRVGAALLAADGSIIKGANIENASYGGTICAERTALVKAASEGTRSFVALAVTTDVAQPLSPCGICRQVIREFCALRMPILLVPAGYTIEKGGIMETTVEGLLPHSFGPEDLELPRTG